MSQFLEQYGDVSFSTLVSESEGGAEAISSGTLVEQMRKQACLNQQTRNQEEAEDDEWDAWAAMQWEDREAWPDEAQSIHDHLMNGPPPSQPSSSSEAAKDAEESAKEEAAKEAAVASYRRAERAIREAISNGQGFDEATRVAYMAAENKEAVDNGIKWRDRGPRGEGAPDFWKGQKWRASSGRYSTRGGQRQKEFAAIHSGQKGKKGGGKNSKGGSHDDKGGGDSNRKGCNKGSNAGGSKSQGGKKGSKADDSQDKPTRLHLALGYCPTCNSCHCRFLVYISIFLYLLGFLVYNPLASSGDNTNSKYE